MLKSWAFIYLSPDFNQTKNYLTTSSKTCQFQAIGIDITQKADVISIAKTLVKQGVETIELCGGFGPEWVAKVSEAINHQIPVDGYVWSWISSAAIWTNEI